MARYVIYACDEVYGGLHGMNNTFVIHGDKEDAHECGKEASYEVMDSYHDITEMLENQAENEFGPDYSDEDMQEVREGNVSYMFSEVREDCTLTDAEIDKMIYNDYQGFVKEYCVEEKIEEEE